MVPVRGEVSRDRYDPVSGSQNCAASVVCARRREGEDAAPDPVAGVGWYGDARPGARGGSSRRECDI